MKVFKVIFLTMILIVNSFAQTKYFVYFTDKGDDAKRLNKTSLVYKQAEEMLTKESIERRKEVMGEDYITFEDLPVSENYVREIEKQGVKVIHKLKWFNAVSCYLDNAQVSQLSKLPFVKSIEHVASFKKKYPEENKIVHPVQINKTNWLLDYGPSITQNNLSDIPPVHDLGINGSGVIIGILDTGFRWKIQPSLQSRQVLAERDFVQGDNNTANEGNDRSDQDSHGTHCFSIMAGYAPSSLIGPAYGAKFILAKTEYVPTETNIEEDNYVAAIEWMEAQGVHITSSSLGYSEFDTGQMSYIYSQLDGKTTKVAKSLNFAFERGVTSFTAAGNEGSTIWGSGYGDNSYGKIISPADAPNAIAVGAVTSQNYVTSFSSRGPSADGRIKPEIVTMGQGVVYGNVAGSFGSGNGTSYATPIAAGIGALLKSAYPHLTNKQIRQIILESGDNTLSPNNERGYGLLSAKKSLSYPNISTVEGNYVINKMFFVDGGINQTSVKIFMRESSGSFQEYPMVKKDNLVFTFSIPQNYVNKNLEFYFSYQNNSGSLTREPLTTNYKYKYGSWAIDNVITDVEKGNEIPTHFSLSQNYPNPFNPSTTIRYQIPVIDALSSAEVHVTLKVYDILGREVATLVDEYKQPGTYYSQFSIHQTNGGQVLNSPLSSGVYFYTMQVGDPSIHSGQYFVQTKKMLLLK